MRVRVPPRVCDLGPASVGDGVQEASLDMTRNAGDGHFSPEAVTASAGGQVRFIDGAAVLGLSTLAPESGAMLLAEKKP